MPVMDLQPAVRGFAMLLALACGCTSGAPAGDRLGSAGPAQGRRLRPRYYFHGDRKLMEADIHDLQLDLICRMAEAPDGTLRCQPLREFDLEFLDPDCQQPFVTFARAQAEPYVGIPVRGPKGQYWEETYRAVASGQVITTRYHRFSSASPCEGDPIPPLTVYPLERVTDQMARGTLERGPVRDGVAALFFQAEGRPVGSWAWFDVKLDRPCTVPYTDARTLVTAADGSPRCLPGATRVGAEGVFSDADCQRPMSGWSEGADTGPSIGTSIVGADACSSQVHVYRLDRPVATPAYLKRYPFETCTPAPAGVVWQTINEVPPGELPAGRLQVVDGPERVRPRVVTTAADSQLGRHAWDEALGEFCEPRRTIDGQLVCAPALVFTNRRKFADPQCTSPLIQAPLPGCGGWNAASLLDDQVGGRLAKVFRVGAPYHGPIFESFGGSCRPEIVPLVSDTYVLGEEIPLSSLAELRTDEP